MLFQNPRTLAQNMTYCEAPVKEEWRIEFLKEPLFVRQVRLELGENEFNEEDINDLIEFVATT